MRRRPVSFIPVGPPWGEAWGAFRNPSSRNSPESHTIFCICQNGGRTGTLRNVTNNPPSAGRQRGRNPHADSSPPPGSASRKVRPPPRNDPWKTIAATAGIAPGRRCTRYVSSRDEIIERVIIDPRSRSSAKASRPPLRGRRPRFAEAFVAVSLGRRQRRPGFDPELQAASSRTTTGSRIVPGSWPGPLDRGPSSGFPRLREGASFKGRLRPPPGRRGEPLRTDVVRRPPMVEWNPRRSYMMMILAGRTSTVSGRRR